MLPQGKRRRQSPVSIVIVLDADLEKHKALAEAIST